MQKEINLSKYSSIKIGPIVNVTIIDEDNFHDHNGFLIGGANNLLFSNNLPPLLILNKKYDFLKIMDGYLHIGAATPNGKIVSFCKKHDIANFEFLSNLPGKLGGAIKMNAGLKETEIFNYLETITINKNIVKREKIDYGYRYTNIQGIIFAASFKINPGFSQEKINNFKRLRNNQPHEASAGSCFKNPENDFAGRLIEISGFKGKRVGNMEFSTIHANFLINHRKDTNRDNYKDALILIEGVKNAVLQEHNIELEEEIIILEA